MYMSVHLSLESRPAPMARDNGPTAQRRRSLLSDARRAVPSGSVDGVQHDRRNVPGDDKRVEMWNRMRDVVYAVLECSSPRWKTQRALQKIDRELLAFVQCIEPYYTDHTTTADGVSMREWLDEMGVELEDAIGSWSNPNSVTVDELVDAFYSLFDPKYVNTTEKALLDTVLGKRA